MSDASIQEELAAALGRLTNDPQQASVATDVERVVQQLQVHQLELEMQNRALRDTQGSLERSRARYADLFDFTPVGYATIDHLGIIREVNLTASAMFNIERADLVNRPFAVAVPQRDIRSGRDHLARCLAHAHPVSSELTLLPQGRTPIIAQIVSMRTRFDEDEQFVCRTTFTDITAVKQAQGLLALLADTSNLLGRSHDSSANIEAVLHRLVPLLGDLAIVDLHDQGNELRRLDLVAADAVSDVRRKDIRGLRVNILDGSPQALAHASGVTQRMACDRGAYGSSSQPSVVLAIPLRARGETLGVLTLMRVSKEGYSAREVTTAEDVAGRMGAAIDSARLLHRSERAVSARDEILSVVSHDLRNQANAIMMATSASMARAPFSERRRDGRKLQVIYRNAEQMRRLTEDLLDLSSIDAGRLAIETTQVDLAKVLEEAYDTWRPVAKSKNVILTLQTSHALVARCDADRVAQVVANLLGNAIKFSRAMGRVELIAEGSREHVAISIRDEGPGICEADQTKLFARRWQAPGTARKGHGLGLYISRGIVLSMGGELSVRSAPGEGATFMFTLPIGEGTTRAAERLAMVVEDDAGLSEAVAAVLRENGYRVVVANHGQHALEALSSGPTPHVILVDLLMPVMDGPTFIGELCRISLPTVPIVVIMSGDRQLSGRDYGVPAHVLHKPFTADGLVDALLRAVDGAVVN